MVEEYRIKAENICLETQSHKDEDDAAEEQDDVDDAEPLLVLGRALHEHA